MDFQSITIQFLQAIKSIAGSYGLAIILLTVVVRFAMWPLNVSQQRSMKKMQTLSPKLKEIQERYKSNPQEMQKKMMEFYKEHKFNPFGGCFPLLIQMPIFILLYSALMSPQFIDMAGKSSFLFIDRLDSTISSHAGVEGDKSFGVQPKDKFSTEKTIVAYVDKGVTKKIEVKDQRNAVQVSGTINPGQPMTLTINPNELNTTPAEFNSIKKADVTLVNTNTKELEHIDFNKSGAFLTANVKTENVKTKFHYDVFILVLLFGATMFLTQKLMSAMNANVSMDPAQKAMQDQMSMMMPIMITGTFLFFPIPAGVLLYLVVSNIFQVIQTMIINKQLEAEDALHKSNVSVTNSNVDNAKKIAGKVNDSDKSTSNKK